MKVARGTGKSNTRFQHRTSQIQSLVNLAFNNGLEAATYLMKKPSEYRAPSENNYISIYLQRLDYFRNLQQKYGQTSFDHICRDIQARSYLKGEVVFNQGDKGEEFYVILSGCVGVYIKGYSDDTENGLSFVVQREVCVLGPGESFGELALLKGKHGLRAATIICKENTDLAYFTANVFNKLLLEKEKDRYDANLGFLQNLEVLKEIPDTVLRAVFMYTKPRNVVCNQIIYEHGDKPEHFYIIKSGSFEIAKPTMICKRPTLVKLCTLSEGEVFGQEELILDTERGCQVKCISAQGELLLMSKSDFRNRLLICDALLKRFHNLMKQSRVQTNQRLLQSEKFTKIMSSPRRSVKLQAPLKHHSIESFQPMKTDEVETKSIYLTQRHLVRSFAQKVAGFRDYYNSIDTIANKQHSEPTRLSFQQLTPRKPQQLTQLSPRAPSKRNSYFIKTGAAPSSEMRNYHFLLKKLEHYKELNQIRLPQEIQVSQLGTKYKAFYQFELDFLNDKLRRDKTKDV